VTLIDLLKLRAPDVKLPDKPIRALGIDLGTTNSTVAEVSWDPANPEGSQVRCIEVEQKTLDGSYIQVLVPSFVALPDGDLVIGEGARRLRARAAEFGLVRNQNLFYECKNDIGTSRKYHRASEGYQSAADIGGKVLGFLRAAALHDSHAEDVRTVVTVPASFQAPQRNDTRQAAEAAGISVKGGDLLDEPVAAFLDYLVSYGERLVSNLAEPKVLLVFDFGGGTCDIALFRLSGGDHSSLVSAAPLSVSRYHRLGGGDIDAAILYEVLLPQLLRQNRMGKFDLGKSGGNQGQSPIRGEVGTPPTFLRIRRTASLRLTAHGLRPRRPIPDSRLKAEARQWFGRFAETPNPKPQIPKPSADFGRWFIREGVPGDEFRMPNAGVRAELVLCRAGPVRPRRARTLTACFCWA